MNLIDYIKDYTIKTTHYSPTNNRHHIGLPHSYVTPCLGIYDGDQYYWDSYFVLLGLIELKEIELARGMIDNFVYLYENFAIMPMRNRWSNLGISQPPYFTSMIEEIYTLRPDKEWLKDVILIAEKELDEYWMGTEKAEKHAVYKGLSRYADHYLLHATAEHESGWDMTSRFNEKCLDFLPIDLNCCLYKYETDLAIFYKELSNQKKHEYYLQRAEKRKTTIQELMWNEKNGFFFDFNYQEKKQSEFYSLAGFYPLWVNIATKEQAEKVRENVHLFENEYGLATSQKNGLHSPFKQWDYPNGWPNLQWIVIKGLMNYGYYEDAKQLAKKWLRLNEKVFAETGKLWEKYNVVTGDIGKSGLYETQSGFGWTNMIYIKLHSLFGD